MLDLFISYINFILIFFSYFIKRLAFLPPDPPGYIKNKKGIRFIVENDEKLKYGKLNFKNAKIENVELKKIKVESDLLIITPKNNVSICIIYCHGNCGDIGFCVYDCYLLAKYTKCVVISFEYPHYGSLKNLEYSEVNTYKSIQIAYIYANKKLKFDYKNIFLYGFSLGTGVAFDLSCKKDFPIGGLILQAPYLSIARIIYNFNKSKFFDIFKSCDKAKKLKAKTLFIHGNKDNIVPYIHGRILAKLIPKIYLYDFYTVNNAEHDNLFIKDEKNIYNKIIEFIEHCSGIQIQIKKLINNKPPIKFSIFRQDNFRKNKSGIISNPLIDNSSSEEIENEDMTKNSKEIENSEEKKLYNKNKNNNNNIIKEESCDNLGEKYIFSDKNDLNFENSSNLNYNNNNQNTNLILDIKKEKTTELKRFKTKSYSFFKKSIKFINDEKKKKNSDIKK